LQRQGTVGFALQSLQPGQHGARSARSHRAPHDGVGSDGAFQAVIFKRLVQNIVDIDRRNTQKFVHRFAAQPHANIPAEFRQSGLVREFHVLQSRRLVVEQGPYCFRKSKVLLPEVRVGFLIQLRETLTRHAVAAINQVLAICIKCDSVNRLAGRVPELLEFEIATYRLT
jgi:hypothetical protein